MIDKIRTIRHQLVDKIDNDIIERGLDRIDIQNMGEVVDMVKDLAVAEEKLRKADYYHGLHSSSSASTITISTH